MAGENCRKRSLRRFSSSTGLFLVFILSFSVDWVALVDAQTNNCNLDLSNILPAPFNASSSLICRPVWQTFVMRYSQNSNNVLSIVLSSVYTSGWVGMGFSKDGLMVGSSAMVGWIGMDGKANIKQFLLRGRLSSEVIADEGQLQIISGPVVILSGTNIYLAFQLKFDSPLTQQPLIFAFASATPNQNVLPIHDARTAVVFDFSAGTQTVSSNIDQLKEYHGILAILGWGVLLPIGAIIARYCKQWDPQWFYLHSVIQFVGYLFGLASVVAGISLYKKLHADFPLHRDIGISVLAFGSLQVIAFFLRPQKDAKIRRYWNWYHHWVGRLVLFLGAVNIIIGIGIGGAGKVWKGAYALILAVILIAVIILELFMRIKQST